MGSVCRHAEGTLSKVNPTYLDLLSLPGPCSVASLLFVVNAPSGLFAGEAVFDAEQLRAVDMRIRAAMLQVQLRLCDGVHRYVTCNITADTDYVTRIKHCELLCFCLH